MSFSGGVFSDTIDGKRASASIDLTERGVRAVTNQTQTVFEIPFSALKLEKGGASGRMMFCRNPEKTVTIFCEDREFADELKAAARGILDDEFAAVRDADVRAGRTRFRWSVAILATLAVLIVVVPIGFNIAVGCTASALPYSVDEMVGEAAIDSMDLGGPEITDPAVVEPVQAIVAQLSPHRELSDATFDVRVIDSKQVNAFALPGGKIVVYRGLLETADSAEEVAGVIAHEMAHVTRRHGMKRLVHSLGLTASIQMLLGDMGGLAALASQFFTLQTVNAYSRDAEREADGEGVRLMHAAGLDALAFAEFFEKLHALESQAESALSWFGTHPAHDERIENVRAQLATMPPLQPQPLGVDWAGLQAALKTGSNSPTTTAPNSPSQTRSSE